MERLSFIVGLILGLIIGMGIVFWISTASASIGPGGVKMGEGNYNSIRINGIPAQTYIKLHSPKVVSPKTEKLPKKGKHK